MATHTLVDRNALAAKLAALLLLVGTVATFARAPAPKPRPAQRPAHELQGEWKAVEVMVGGKPLPAADLRDFSVLFQPDRMRSQRVPALLRMPASATLKLNTGTTPRSLDLGWLEGVNQQTTSLGIYQIHKGQLKIALRLPDHAHRSRPAGYSTVSGTLVSITLERVKAVPIRVRGQ